MKEPGARAEGTRPLDDLKVQAPGLVEKPGGGWRLYYTAVGTGRPFAACQGYILSAVSDDGLSFAPEPGIRVGPDANVPPRSLRALAPTVTQLADGRWRMYFESRGAADRPFTICSAVSEDQVAWTVEPGVRLAAFDRMGGPRYTSLSGGRGRLYCHASRRSQASVGSGDRESVGVVSAVTDDGLQFNLEPRVRLRGGHSDITSGAITAAEVLPPSGGIDRWVMVYSCWQNAPDGADIPAHPSDEVDEAESGEGGDGGAGAGADFAARSVASDLAGYRSRLFVTYSDDGLSFEPGLLVLEGEGYGGSGLDAIHAEDMCVAVLDDGGHRIYYASCDTAGNWRVVSAIAPKARKKRPAPKRCRPNPTWGGNATNQCEAPYLGCRLVVNDATNSRTDERLVPAHRRWMPAKAAVDWPIGVS